ncbi:MAG: hypothetical protein U5L45_03915 [Saprospiraceae bacterium]|nr:hypothetical protein [Saprospiraceae bacterium]
MLRSRKKRGGSFSGFARKMNHIPTTRASEASAAKYVRINHKK